MPRRSVVVSFVVVAALVAGAHAAARGGEASTTARTIASTSTSDFRVVVTAARLDEGPAPSAALTATTFTRTENRWRRTGKHPLGGSYFWKTVTGPRAVCRLEIRTTGSSAAFKPRAIVQLLVTPSLGCGPAERVFVE
jgi:hypothetical protein